MLQKTSNELGQKGVKQEKKRKENKKEKIEWGGVEKTKSGFREREWE